MKSDRSPVADMSRLSTDPDALAEGFLSPPSSARPRTWWHWMNGNITQDGIKKDLHWMKRIGLAGVHSFDGNYVTPQIVDRRIAYMTAEWKAAFNVAATTADQLGLELGIASSPGWSESGGPWVQACDGMKKLVWSTVEVSGGERRTVHMPALPSTTGHFQDLALDLEGMSRLSGGQQYVAPSYHADAVVLAFPVDATQPLHLPRLRSDDKDLDANILNDGSLSTFLEVRRPVDGAETVVNIEFEQAQTVRSATVFFRHTVTQMTAAMLPTRLEFSQDGKHWEKLVDVALASVPTTVSFPPVTGRLFRLVVESRSGAINLKPEPGADLTLLAALAATKPTLPLTLLELSGEAKVNMFEAKAGFEVVADYYGLDDHVGADIGGIPEDQVVDLTGSMRADGTLDWTPPAGRWKVIRLGYSLTGKVNHPASFEGTGLEVDKYDAAAVRAYFEHYLGMFREAVGSSLLGRRGVQAMVTDSIEFGASNWTPRLLEHFKRLRGYDATPFLPALIGVIVGSRSRSDAFLYDYRRTLGELLASEHYGTAAAVAREHGLKLYGESHEGARPALGDDMQLRKYTDFPMAALWTYSRADGPKSAYLADMKTAASVAHVYGKAAVAAEAMTSVLAPWAHAPADMRRVMDMQFANGINLPCIHTSPHQPLDDKQPGISLFFFGQFFTRHETWAEMAGPWIDYMARCSFLLQQGKDVADVAYFHGEEAPITRIFDDVPSRFAYDFVNADMLLNSMAADDGALVTPGGACYKALYLGGSSSRMTLPVLRRIADLVADGATVIGVAPECSPGLNEDTDEYRALVRQLWSGDVGAVNERGGRVVVAENADAAFDTLGVEPDFSAVKAAADSQLRFVHRTLEDADIYFVCNTLNRPETVEARFRVHGRVPEIWHADSGRVESAAYRMDGGFTFVSLDFKAEGSFFVVFRRPTTAASGSAERTVVAPVLDIDGPWDVAFQPGRGAPSSITLASLASLSEQVEPGVKYFSGVASYSKSVCFEGAGAPGASILLDLGAVGDVAEVFVNGERMGVAWHPPYQVDITRALKAGNNQLEVRVANLWLNRLVGDQQPEAQKIAFVTMPTYSAGAPLRPSGLIGPVQLISSTKVTA